MADFMDSEPTYNTSVIRSQMAPQTKFDNIMFDSERHPSGVYDVPASTSTTPGVSRVAPPEFATHVKVDVEDDDDDDAFGDAAVIVPTQSRHLYKQPNTVKCTYQNTDELSAKAQPRLSINLDLYRDLLEGDRDSSSANERVDSSRSSDSSSSRRVHAPTLPPRTQSMIDELASPAAHDDDVTRPHSLLVNMTEEAVVNASRVASPVQSQRSTLQSQTSCTSQTNSPMYSSPASENAGGNLTREQSVSDTSTDYYRSMLRHQPVSGVYDNNLDNMPSSPYCMKQAGFPY